LPSHSFQTDLSAEQGSRGFATSRRDTAVLGIEQTADMTPTRSYVFGEACPKTLAPSLPRFNLSQNLLADSGLKRLAYLSPRQELVR
jgi:hypothetical protein